MQQPVCYQQYMANNQGNFPQSLSGSETDVSTSNENLSNEEKYVIRHTARQEPQGQENLQASNRSSLRDSLPSNRSSLDVSSSSYNTLIIHNIGDEPWSGRNSGTRESSEPLPPSYIMHQSQSIYSNEAKMSPVQKRSSVSPSPSIASSGKDQSIRNSLEANNNNARYFDQGVQEITEIPEDYLNQSSVLKHLAKEVKLPHMKDTNENMKYESNMYEVNNLPPPPEYPKWAENPQNNNKISIEKMNFSKSQPDLSSIGAGKVNDFSGFRRGVSAPRPPTKGRAECSTKEAEPWPSAEMVEILIKENSALRIELDNCCQRVAKMQKLEQDFYKVNKAYEDLVQSGERREKLEKAARTKLQADCRRLQETNKILREQLGALLTATPDTSGPDSLRREIGKRDCTIAQLITQNKELAAAKERQEIELAAQRATLQEQRTHIDILDTALTNAQANVVRLEEEGRKKQVYVERVLQLQKALSSLQLASDKREQTERHLRAQLEGELQRAKGTSQPYGMCTGGAGELAELQKRLRERDGQVMRLEGECAKWEQRYLEESALRQAAIDAASIPKDAKIAALEKTSQETEKIIAEARNEKIRHMDEVHAAQKKVAELESKLKDLESKLAERDAMIRVLQKHTYDKDVSSMLTRSPHHTPHASSLGGTDIDHVLGATVSREELVNGVLASSPSYTPSSNSYAGSESYHVPSYSKYQNKSFDSTKPTTLDTQLKDIDSQLDSQLLSKRALCCFPGFTNPVAAQRKGKLSKPLLAGVTSNATGLFDSGAAFLLQPARHQSGEMLLLEKQGRTSQQQRMQEQGSSEMRAPESSSSGNKCPAPSSLPRPPRSSHRSGLPRRMGDYNRLPDTEMPRKKSDGGDSLSSSTSSRRVSPARSLIPSPKKFGEYGRLSESGGSSSSLRKPSSIRASSAGSTGERNSASSENSASSLPTPAKAKMYVGTPIRRGSSLGRDSKSSTDTSINKYRIQF